MENKIFRHKFILLLLLLTLNTHSIVFGQYSWDKPVEIPKNASAEEIEKIENFNEEIRLAKEAPDRNSKVEYMKKALTCRPDDPDNIRIEYKMAVMLSQYRDRENPQPMRREEALAIYEKIVNTYDHIQYYNKWPESSIGHPGIMVPRAAVHAAGLANILYDDELKARKYAEKAMKCLQMTYERRREDWLNEPRPPEVELGNPFGGPHERAKWEGRIEDWQNRQKDAAEGKVFGNLEMLVAEAAVRQYGYSFGRPQGFADIVLAMSNIVRDYPNTPMAKIAEGHIERGKEKVLNDLNSEILEESIANLESPGTSTKSKPIASEKDLASAEILIPKGKELFIPKASIALQERKAFVLDLASGKLLNPAAKVRSEPLHKKLLKLGKGDIAWDSFLLSVRKAKALTVRQESHRPLKYTPGRWCNSDRLPDKVDLPYSLLVVTNEDVDYLISILEIKSGGIKIKYKKLTAEEAKSYYPIQKNGK